MSSKDFTVLLIRLALGLIYLTAGFSKLAPHLIGNVIGPVDPKMLFDSEFFRVFMLFVAVYQIIAGALLLSQRYSVYGLILLFPIALGIMIFTFVIPFCTDSLSESGLSFNVDLWAFPRERICLNNIKRKF